MGRKEKILSCTGRYYKVKSPPGDKNHPGSRYPIPGWIVARADNAQDLKQRLALCLLQKKEVSILTEEETQITLRHMEKFRTNHKVQR